MQSVFLGVAFLANEKIESYEWLFNTFLKAMCGVASHLIITDEDASMKDAIAQILPDTTHRLCMWHIMEKVPEKVRPSIREDEQFWDRLHTCVWGSETSDDFESQWNSIITDFALMGNDWFSTTPKLMTPWAMEKPCSVIYTHEVFSKFHEQILAARDHCIIQGITECEDIKIVTISSLSGKERVV